MALFLTPNACLTCLSNQLQYDEAGHDHARPDHTQRLLIDLLQLLGEAFPEPGRREQEQPLDHQHEAERGAEARHGARRYLLSCR